MQQRISKFNRILKIREDSRKNEQAILAAERSEEQAVLNHLSQLEGEKAQAIHDFSRTGTQSISANDLWFQRQFIDAIDTDITKGKPENLSSDEQDTVDVVLRDYGDMSPYELRELSHSEAPYIEARQGLPDGARCSAVITKASMGAFYGSL